MPALLTLVTAVFTATTILATPSVARADGTIPSAERTIATARLPAGPRFVVATVTVGPAKRITLFTVELDCAGQVVQATTNVLTGATLQPRRLIRDGRHCIVRARTGGLRTAVRITSAPIRWGITGQNPNAWPVILRPGQRHDAVPVSGTAPAGATTIRLAGDIKLTTCTVVNGSRENGSPNLCAANRVNRAGTRIRVTLVGQQRNTRGGYCQTRAVSTRLVHINRYVHHATVTQIGTFPISRAPGCTRNVRVKLYISVLSGADVVVHRRGTITNAWRS
jgi:hypothetical protein